MDWLNRYVQRISAKWPFRVVLIGLPVIASCLWGELALAAEWGRHHNSVGVIIDLIPAVSALVLLVVFALALPLRARCEGRQISTIARVLAAVATFCGGWIGGCIAEIIITSRNQHHPMLFDEAFQMGSSILAMLVNLFASFALTREVLNRCPVEPEITTPTETMS